jgi:hypothetical protein
MMRSSRTSKKSDGSVECELDGSHIVVASHDDDDDDTELTWRLDARKSLSDWAVLVTAKETTTTQVYNVHKNYLAVGPRKSLYFVRAFAVHTKKQQEEREKLKVQQHQQQLQAQKSQHEKKAGFTKQFPFHTGIEPCELITRTLRHDRASSSSKTGGAADSSMIRNHQMVTKLDLPKLAAEVFPQVLDYIYSGKLDIHTHNVTALHYLADLLEIKALVRLTRAYWQKDLCVDKLCIYYRHAAVVGDAHILRHAQEFCARHIFEIPEDLVVQVLTAIDGEFFYQVISHHAMVGQHNGEEGDISDGGGESEEEEKSSKVVSTRGVRALSSKRLSLIVAVYCNIHRQDLTADTFLKLVGPDILPEIDVKAAKVLLELEYYICRDDDKLTSLKRRCIKVVSKKWDHACIDSKDFNLVSLPRLGGEALERFVSLSFTNAKERLSTLDQIYEEWDKVHAELTRLRSEVKQLRDEKNNVFQSNAAFHNSPKSHSAPLRKTAVRDTSVSAQAYTERAAASRPSSDLQTPVQMHVSAFDNRCARSMTTAAAGDAAQASGEAPQHIPRHVESSRQMHSHEQSPRAAQTDFVAENNPIRVDAIQMARSRQQKALSAYEQAVATLKHATAESEKVVLNAYTPSEVTQPTTNVSSRPTSKQIRRDSEERAIRRGSGEHASHKQVERISREYKGRMESSIDATHEKHEPHRSSRDKRSERDHKAKKTKRPVPSPISAPVAITSETHPASVMGVGSSRRRSGRHASETTVAAPTTDQTNHSRPQDFIADAATTAKSIFSFTTNYLKTSKSKLTGSHSPDSTQQQGSVGNNLRAGRDAMSTSKKSADTDGYSTASSSPVSVAVFEDASSAFDVGGFVHQAISSESHASPGGVVVKQKNRYYPPTTTTVAPSTTIRPEPAGKTAPEVSTATSW